MHRKNENFAVRRPIRLARTSGVDSVLSKTDQYWLMRSKDSLHDYSSN
jgi:hypothetical protein